MIVVDSSAIVAILKKEPDGPKLLAAIQTADRAIISAVNAYEAGMVLRARLGPGGPQDLHDLLAALDVEIVPFDAADARASLDAFDRYGKGLPPLPRTSISATVSPTRLPRGSMCLCSSRATTSSGRTSRPVARPKAKD